MIPADIKEIRVAVDSHTAADYVLPTLTRGIKILEAIAIVNGTDATACVMSLDKRILAGSDTGRVSGLLTITLPAADKNGKLYYKKTSDAAPKLANAGDQLVLAVTTASTADKVGDVVVRYVEITDLSANEQDCVASA